MTARGLRTASIVLVSLAVGFLLAGGTLAPKAHGQSEGLTRGIICVMGQAVNQYAPIVLVDVPDQTVLVYEYSYQNDDIELTAARTFRWDKLLTELNNTGVKVEEVMRAVSEVR